MNTHAKTFRTLFQEAIQPYVELPLMLSGGIDSATNLAAILSLGYKPPCCYTFRLGENISSDMQVARSMCKAFSIPHKEVVIPHNEETLLTDIKRVMHIIHKSKKVHVQVCQPFLYLAKQVVDDGYAEATFAMAADDLWGSSRQIAAYIKTKGEEWVRGMRKYYIEYVGGSDDSVVKTSLACGLQLHDPWRNPKIIEFMLARNWVDMHTPKLKSLALNAFPEFWKQGSWYRVNSSLQVNSGIREWHDTLLQSKYNVTNAKVIVVLYRRFLSEIEEAK